jgi:hypothetical protein
MNQILNTETVRHYVKERFLLTESELFNPETRSKFFVNHTIGLTFKHFLDLEVNENVGLFYINPYDAKHHVKLANYSDFNRINSMDELSKSLRKYQILKLQISNDLIFSERIRLLKADQSINNNELER